MGLLGTKLKDDKLLEAYALLQSCQKEIDPIITLRDVKIEERGGKQSFIDNERFDKEMSKAFSKLQRGLAALFK